MLIIFLHLSFIQAAEHGWINSGNCVEQLLLKCTTTWLFHIAYYKFYYMLLGHFCILQNDLTSFFLPNLNPSLDPSQAIKTLEQSLNVFSVSYYQKISFLISGKLVSLFTDTYICVCIYTCTHTHIYTHIMKLTTHFYVQSKTRNSVLLCMQAQVLQSCLTLCNPIDSSPPGFSVHRVSQASILEWVVISFSKGSSQPKDGTGIS